MNKVLLYLFVFIFSGSSSFAQNHTFSIKELLILKEHNSHFFHDYVTKKGYVYQRSKYDKKRQNYSCFLLADLDHDLRNITYTQTETGTSITYGTTDSIDYEQFKKQLELLQFRIVKSVPKQENGRSVIMIVYTDGNTHIHLYNSYIQDDDDALVNYYRIKIM